MQYVRPRNKWLRTYARLDPSFVVGRAATRAKARIYIPAFSRV